MSIMDTIRERQAGKVLPSHKTPPVHAPEMLYIGCIDARLDPINDIGIAKGKAIIFRNIGALVPADEGAMQNISMGAALEFFLRYAAARPGLVRHIVISGHTDCGGLKACRHGKFDEGDSHLRAYLDSLKDMRERIYREADVNGWDEEQILHALEKESVRSSIHNLQSYSCVRQALEERTLQLHGWIIDTATQHIREMHPETGDFEPLVAYAS